MQETRLWRIANSAQWVAWGIVQAKVPGMDTDYSSQKSTDAVHHGIDDNTADDGEESTTVTPLGSAPQDPNATSTAKVKEACHPHNGIGVVKQEEREQHENEQEGPEELEDDDEAEFDYLAYAQDRALFFLGDVLQLGLIRKEDLPANLLQKIKFVEY